MKLEYVKSKSTIIIIYAILIHVLINSFIKSYSNFTFPLNICNLTTIRLKYVIRRAFLSFNATKCFVGVDNVIINYIHRSNMMLPSKVRNLFCDRVIPSFHPLQIDAP